MVTVDRYLAGLVPYKAVFFPTDQALAELTEWSKPIQMARLFWTPTELQREPRGTAREKRNCLYRSGRHARNAHEGDCQEHSL